MTKKDDLQRAENQQTIWYIAQQDSTPQLKWRYFVIELWIYVNPTSEQKGVY